MSERSQIFVFMNNKLVIGNDYSWNFGSRMISRLRHTIERMSDSFYIDKEKVKKIRRYLDVNFDYQDIVLSENILKYLPEKDFLEYILEIDNSNGQLYIFFDSEENKLSYSILNEGKTYDAGSYMQWQHGSKEVKWYYSEGLCPEEVKFTKKNIKFLKDYTFLSKDELFSKLQKCSYEKVKEEKYVTILKDLDSNDTDAVIISEYYSSEEIKDCICSVKETHEDDYQWEHLLEALPSECEVYSKWENLKTVYY